MAKQSKSSASRRSASARKAAIAAWKTMHSQGYIRAEKKGRKAVQAFLDNR